MKLLVGAALCCAVAVNSTAAQRASVGSGEVGTMSGPVAGASAQIVRTDNGISCKFRTTKLHAGHAFSVWIIITEPDKDVFVFNFGGGMADANGDLTFAGAVSTGTIPPANGSSILRGGGVFNHPRDANIFLVVRSHGPMIPGMQHLQFFTINGGCRAGEPNEGMCADKQHVAY
jgi:hypothetical protein